MASESVAESTIRCLIIDLETAAERLAQARALIRMINLAAAHAPSDGLPFDDAHGGVLALLAEAEARLVSAVSG